MTTKTCTKCNLTKEATSEFFYKKPPSRKPVAGDLGLNTICKACVIAKVSAWGKNNKDKVNLKDRKARASLSAWVNSLKEAPCTDCGVQYPPVCMDFDHLPGTEKIMDLATARARKWSKGKILAEIDKCELVCSNCHRIRTANRKGVMSDE